MEEEAEKTGVWQGLENRYYDLLDALDSKGIPVYALVDPIDRIVPSFLVFFLLLIGLLAFGLASVQEKPLMHEIRFVDAQNNPVQSVSVVLQIENNKLQKISDAAGKIVFESKPLSRIFLRASKAGFNPLEQTIVVGKENFQKTVLLTSVLDQSLFSIQFVGPDQQAIRGKKIAFLLSCSNPGIMPEKTDFETDSEQSVLVSQPANCGGLLVTVRSPNEFAGHSYPVSGTHSVIALMQSDSARTVGENTLFISAVDESGNPVARAKVRLLNALNGELQSFTLDETGTATVSVKTDESLVVSVEQDGFLTFFSAPIDWKKSPRQSVGAILKKTRDTSTVRVEFRGVVDSYNNPVQTMAGAKTYLALFDVVIPAAQSYSQATAFFRLEKKSNNKNEDAWIEGLHASNARFALGVSYNPDNGSEIDLAGNNQVSENGVWGQATFAQPEGGLRRIEVAFRANELVNAQSQWVLHYNAQGQLAATGTLELDPADGAVISQAKEWLYANSYEQPLVFGATEESLCTSELCFSSVQLKETASGEQQTEPFFVLNNRAYELSFELQNKAGKDLNAVSFFVANEQNNAPAKQITISDFSLQPPNAPRIEQTANDSQTLPVLLDIAAGENVPAMVRIMPNATQASSLVLHAELFDRTRVEKSIDFQIGRKKKFKTIVLPTELLPLKETTLQVLVLEEDTAKPVASAAVFVHAVGTNDNQQEKETQTDAAGQASIGLFALSPNSALSIIVNKNGFETQTIEKTVSSLVEFSPNQLDTTLGGNGPGARQKDTLSWTVLNKSSNALTIEKTELNGVFAGVLNLARLQAALDAQNGTRLEPNQDTPLSLDIALDPDFSLEQPMDFSGGIRLLVSTIDAEQYWFEIPLIVHAIPPQGTVSQYRSCLEISPVKWTAVTQQNKARLDFTLTNRCKDSSKKPLLFDSLQAVLAWKSGKLGNLELELASDELSLQPKIQTLNPLQASTVLTEVLPGLEYNGHLVFTPQADSLGKAAQFQVLFSGKKNKKRIFSDPLVSNILVANLQDCLEFVPKPHEGLQIPFDGTQQFRISSALCGGIALSIKLCPNDDGCSGGASLGKLAVSPAEFSLDATHTLQEISVQAKSAPDNLPGAYDIPVAVHIPNSAETAVITAMDVSIDNNPHGFFGLDKFEFFVKNNGKDSAVLNNWHLSKRILVKARAQDWANTAKPRDGGLDGSQAAGSGLDSAAIDNLNPALDAARTDAQLMAADAANKLDAARNAADQALNLQNNASQQTDTAKQVTGQALGLADSGAQTAQSMATQCETPLSACAAAIPVPVLCSAEAPAEITKLCPSARSLFSGMSQAIGAPLRSAFDDLGKAFQTMGPAQPEVMGPPAPTGQTAPAGQPLAGQPTAFFSSAEFQAGGNAVSSSADAQSQINQSRESSAVPATAQTASGALAASSQANQSCLSNNKAGLFDKQAQQNTAQAGTGTLQAGLGLGGNTAHTGLFEGALASSPCVNTFCQPQVAQLRTQFYSFKGVQTGLQGGEASVDQASKNTNAAQNGQQQAELASQGASGAACLASDKLRQLAQASQTVSDDAGGANGEIPQDLANAGAGNGLLDGMTNGIYQNETVTNSLTGYLTNLATDAKNIQTDSPSILGRFNLENALVFNNYQKQHVGIEFENAGLEGDKPVYSTVTVTALEHQYPDNGPLEVPAGETDWGMLRLENVADAAQAPKEIAQQFHLKFNPSEKSEAPAPNQTSSASCFQGAMIGETGAHALPKIKLSWQWSDISLNACSPQQVNGAKNPNYVYCDATQFGITLVKRVHALEEFVQANPALPCPENPYQTLLDKEMQPFNEFLPAIGGSVFSSGDFVPQCWLPESTQLLDGKPSLYWYVKDALEKGTNIVWTNEIPNLESLNRMVQFDSYLIQDGYTPDFFKDFAAYYTTIHFSDTPGFFYLDGAGKNYNQYFEGAENGFLSVREKFTGSKQLPTSGKYRVELNVEFGAGDKLFDKAWDLFDTSGKPIGKIEANVLAEKQAETSNPFYYIPFDGAVGLEQNELRRDGYGVRFDTKKDAAFAIARASKTLALPSNASNGIQMLSIVRKNKLENLNARASQRGILMDLESVSNTEKKLAFSPSLATPVVLQFSHSKTANAFSGFFSVRRAETFATAGENMSYWTGMGSACKNFDATPLKNAFSENPDRKAGESDRGKVQNLENAYALDWKNAAKDGSVFLKSIFFTPPEQAFTLQSESTGLSFFSPDAQTTGSVELSGVSDMPFNRGNQTDSDKLTALDDLFELVKNEYVCVTNSGSRTMYWWNPQKLFEQNGKTGQSIQSFEDNIKNACIR